MELSQTETKSRRGAPLGNRNAVKNQPVRELLREIIAADNGAKLREGLERLLDRAAGGDLDALSFITDRLDGRPRQALEMTGEDGGPIVVSEVRSLLDGSVDELMARVADESWR